MKRKILDFQGKDLHNCSVRKPHDWENVMAMFRILFWSFSRNDNKESWNLLETKSSHFLSKFSLWRRKKQKRPQLGTFYICWKPEKAWREIHRSGGRFGAWREIRAFGGRSPTIWREVATLIWRRLAQEAGTCELVSGPSRHCRCPQPAARGVKYSMSRFAVLLCLAPLLLNVRPSYAHGPLIPFATALSPYIDAGDMLHKHLIASLCSTVAIVALTETRQYSVCYWVPGTSAHRLYRRDFGRFPVSASWLASANPASLSSTWHKNLKKRLSGSAQSVRNKPLLVSISKNVKNWCSTAWF